MRNEITKAAIYCRYSKDDGKIEDSSSIQTQKDMLAKYVKEQGWSLSVSNIYVDDGYSGLSTENRPEFQRMMRDIDNGAFQVLVIKDNSRLARNYLEAGMLIECILPKKGIRFISLNDGIDTEKNQGMDIAPFKNILNEFYSRDLSKKVSSAKKSRAMQGKYMCTFAPYGYKKDPLDHNHLVINEVAEKVVKRIYELALKGYGVTKITDILSDEKIPIPSETTYAGSEILNRPHLTDENLPNYKHWSRATVRDILTNPVYIGNLAAYRRPQQSFKCKSRYSTKPEEWLIVEGTHEAIISKEDFETVQKMIISRRREKRNNFDNIFSGLLKCEDCGYSMVVKSRNCKPRENPLENYGYGCNKFATYGKKKSNCSGHNILAVDLHRIVLEDIKMHANTALMTKDFTDSMLKKLNKIGNSENANLKKELRKSKNRLAELDNIFLKLYEDSTKGKVNERNFLMMSQKYENEQSQLQSRISEIENILSAEDKSKQNVADFTIEIQKYADIIELTSEILHRLIDKITIGEKYTGEDGEIHQNVTIYYKFVGNIG